MSTNSTYFPVGNKEPMLTLTRPTAKLWVIELHNGVHNVLALTFVNDAIRPALDVVEEEWRKSLQAVKTKGKSAGPDEGKGALIIIGKRDQNKFFSNGLDFAHAIRDPVSFFIKGYNLLLKRLLTFPIPTLAAINGHCFAGGMMLALCCDYRVMTDGERRNTWMCMNEIHLGSPWPLSFVSTLQVKVVDANLRRKIALEGHRFTPQEALAAGLVDRIVPGDSAEAVLSMARELAESVDSLARSGAWGLIKSDLYRDAMNTFDLPSRLPPEPERAAASVRTRM
ncbi:ClpP/crotonase-like domain-containing protein [Thelephora terrestris]|uniref:ClpP/crotonase-like domain-containing protein n=1 Tax=Thelephora terrestris TaxID=56493 RepID=A0A9P6LAQ5_9AGAM|nr:ClpP/crotonase-like domain-containing protein [Thelephora terrestris]